MRTWNRADFLAVLFATIFPSLVTLVYFVWAAAWPPWVQQSLYGVGKVAQFAFPLIWVFAVRREGIRGRRPPAAGALEGAVFGVAVLAFTVMAYHFWLAAAGVFESAAAPVVRKVQGLGIDSPQRYLALATFYAIGHSFLEEYYWRWFVFDRWRRTIGWRRAVGISSLGFMAHHVIVLSIFFGPFAAATIVFSLAVGVGGAYWAWLYQRTGSLLGPWIGHLFVDAGIFLVGYELVRDAIAAPSLTILWGVS